MKRGQLLIPAPVCIQNGVGRCGGVHFPRNTQVETDKISVPKNPRGYSLLWALALLSVAGNVVLVATFSQTDRIRDEVVKAARSVPLDPVPLSFTVGVSDSLPISMDVPVQKTIKVPLEMTVPIDQVVTLDLQIMKRVVPVRLPIRTEVPVKTTLLVPLDEVFEVRSTVPLNLTLPVNVEVDLDPFRDAILSAAEDL